MGDDGKCETESVLDAPTRFLRDFGGVPVCPDCSDRFVRVVFEVCAGHDSADDLVSLRDSVDGDGRDDHSATDEAKAVRLIVGTLHCQWIFLGGEIVDVHVRFSVGNCDSCHRDFLGSVELDVLLASRGLSIVEIGVAERAKPLRRKPPAMSVQSSRELGGHQGVGATIFRVTFGLRLSPS